MAAFRATQGRFPTTKRPAQWLSLPRRAHMAGAVPEDRCQVLAAMPGWDRN